ncbi:MAG: CHASE2 domain-containing protein [Alphaproteobacteria bacterium]
MPRLSRLLCCPLVAGAIAAVATAGYLLGGFRLVDNAIQDLRMRTLDLAASGGLVVVEIDADSLHRLGQWPWPRGHHAMVLDRLIDAGAARVGFDVSFSSASDTAQDRRLADSARAAGERLLLPVFRQQVRRGDGTLDYITDRPLQSLFRDVPLASINVRPDYDGIARRMNATDRIDGVAVPGMAAALLGRTAPADAPAESFLIDFGIDPRTLPRLSYADVLIGNFDRSLIAGRAVLVGATAVELGDVLAVPRWGNLPGPLVIATAYESLRQQRAIHPLEDAWFVFLLCLAAAAAPAIGRSQSLQATLIPAALQLAGLFAIGEAAYAMAALKLDLAPVALCLAVAHGIQIARVLRAQSQRIAQQNREAERRQALLRSVVDTTIDAVAITDRRGAVLIANPACETIFGRSADSLVGMSATALIDPYDRIAPLLRAMMHDGGTVPGLQYPVDVVGVHADGSALELELALAGIGAEDGAADPLLETQYYIFVFRDVSEQRRLEAMRRLALEAQVEAERSKSDFLATASHELRTPLNHIIGFTSLLGEGVGGAVTDQQRDYLGNISTAAESLLQIVSDILSYAESGGRAFGEGWEDAPVPGLIDEACRKVSTLAAARRVALGVSRGDDDTVVAVDREAVVTALMHVIRNAVQFTPEGGQVAVAAARTADMVQILVVDHGPGLSRDEIARILRPFGQVEGALSRKHGGMGIGLNVVRTCMDHHGGKLALESEPGRGTTVTLELPLARPAAAGARSAA